MPEWKGAGDFAAGKEVAATRKELEWNPWMAGRGRRFRKTWRGGGGKERERHTHTDVLFVITFVPLSYRYIFMPPFGERQTPAHNNS